MNTRALSIAAGVLVALVLISQSLFTVKETEFAINLQLGELVRSDYAPGLHVKMPLLQTVEKFEKRVMTRNYPSEQFLTSEGKILNVDFYVKWRIADVSQYFRSTGGSEDAAAARLAEVVKDGLKGTIARHTIQQVVAAERAELIADVLNFAGSSVTKLGVTLVDVRVKRIELPDDVSDSVFNRMRQDFARQAAQLRAEGEEQAIKIRAESERQRTEILSAAARDAEKVRGEGDAHAANIFASATAKYPEFFAFYRSMQAYRKAVGREGDVLVLSLDSQFFKYLQQPGGGK
ncbi:MAG TPA: protease modulator HflC [Steroidobacteraceae bacterium]|nr:protease modulator HflC [Steroidobacteraceae bacterium]